MIYSSTRHASLILMTDSVILINGSGERIDAKVTAEARNEKLVPHPKAKVNPATVNKESGPKSPRVKCPGSHANQRGVIKPLFFITSSF